METIENNENNKLSRAKLLQMWKANKQKPKVDETINNIDDTTSNSPIIRSPAPYVGNSVSNYYRNIFDGRSNSESKPARPTRGVSPMRITNNNTGKSVEKKKMNTLPPTRANAAFESGINRDPIFQSLAETVSSLFPTSTTSTSNLTMNNTSSHQQVAEKGTLPFKENKQPEQVLDMKFLSPESSAVLRNMEALNNENRWINNNKQNQDNVDASRNSLNNLFSNSTNGMSNNDNPAVSGSSSRLSLPRKLSGFSNLSSTSPFSDTNSVNIKSRQSIEKMHEKINFLENALKIFQVENEFLKNKERESENRIKMAVEEHQALYFLIDVQNLKLKEYEDAISTNRLKQNELVSQRNRKHKAEVSRLNKERAGYEGKADSLIAQMTEQMNALQTMAMARIEELETGLMEERRKTSELEAHIAKLERNGGGNTIGGEASSKLSPLWKAYTHKEQEQSFGKESDEDNTRLSKSSEPDFEPTPKKGHNKRRETLLHVRGESKSADSADCYRDEI